MTWLGRHMDIALMVACAVLFVLTWAAAPSDARLHSHDGGHTWHAHIGGGR